MAYLKNILIKEIHINATCQKTISYQKNLNLLKLKQHSNLDLDLKHGKPYTDKTLESLPNEGIKNLLVICPGFASDCVETLEEILIREKESFINAGGQNFDLVPCLNDSDDHIKLFKHLINSYLIRK